MTARTTAIALTIEERQALEASAGRRHRGNVLATPHLGYVIEGLYQTFYGDTVRNIIEWLDHGDPRL